MTQRADESQIRELFRAKIESLWETPPARPTIILRKDDLKRCLDGHKAWIESIRDPGAKLSGRRAILRDMDLRGVVLSRRDLRGADLAGANLEGAKLDGALLTLADLSGANLCGADLRGAALRKAKLFGARLDGADLAGADLDQQSQGRPEAALSQPSRA